MMFCGSNYRLKVNGNLLNNERSVAIIPDGINSVIYVKEMGEYDEWKSKIKESFDLEISNTDFKSTLKLVDVVITFECNAVVELLLKFR